jgi:hypothetical protein
VYFNRGNGKIEDEAYFALKESLNDIFIKDYQ